MPSISLKIVLQDGAVTRTMKFPDGATVADAAQMIEEKVLTGGSGKDYGLFLTSADDQRSGCWLQDPHRLDYYLLKDGDSLHYRCRVRTLRIRMLDGSVRTMQVDESKPVETLMMNVCTKLGITNHEEYGLCREDEPMEEQPASTGTLTLKRKHQHKEKDTALQQLSKKLKTDDNVEWLEQHKTLREMAVAPTETLLLKRRLFYSDRKVDARDPVQLNLLYVQARDAVLEGRHPVTEEQALKFAAIQCQVQYGDYQEDKHKTGFIENLNEFLPKNYASGRTIEKKIIKEHSTHAGLSHIEAKLLYTKTARDLPTYGVTFFLVKEMQKGKKKLVPRLLGINASSILRLDETTKEVLQVWPLTQVKTYKAGKGEMFTLNFGDYSEKEYCVKTNDAYRIRDILQGYIDLIRKKMEEAFNNTGDEGGVIHSANVESGKSTMMEVVSNSAHKGVETSFVGPSKIISAETGSKALTHGTQIVTAHTVIVTNQQRSEQTVYTGGAKMRGEMSVDTGKKLNDLNSNAVKIATFLNDPNQANIDEAKKIIDVVVNDMPVLVQGVKSCIDQQSDEAAKKKLTFELDELTDNVAQLSRFRNPQEAQEAAMRIADLTTQMYFALDARVKRRSQLVKSSRKSFIEDEKTQSTLHRASFINCVGAANHAIDDARDTLNKKYEGPILSAKEVEELERSARDRLAKLNAAIARLAAAHSDPKNIDYAAAVSAMNTIKELLPELANDAQALSAVKDGKDRSSLIREMHELLDATGIISQNIGCDDLQKLHDESNNFAKKSRRLQFIFGQAVQPGKENEIIGLAKDVDDKTRLLTATAKQLASEVNDPSAPKVKQAADNCTNAAGGLTSCAELTAYSMHEPHCRSALSAAVEDLASLEKLLDSAYRPLLEHPEGHNRSDLIKIQSAELKKALDRLRNACGALDDTSHMDIPDAADRERKRLQFVSTLSGTQETLSSCDKILKDKYKGPALSPKETEQLEHLARDRLAKLDDAIARLTAAHADPKNVNYAAAADAMKTIKELAPELANDAQALSTVKDNKDRNSLIKALQELIDATGNISQSISSDNLQKMHASANDYSRKASRLQFILGQGGDTSHMDIPDAADRERKRLQFVSTLSGAQETLSSCDKILKDKYKGPALSPKETEQLERLARDRLAKLNDAIARLTAAHADPKNVDYVAAADAMKTIKELTPELAKDAQALSTVKDNKDRNSLIKALQELIDATGNISQTIGSDNLQKMHASANDYSRKASRLQFILGQGGDMVPEAVDRDRKRLQFASTLSGTQESLKSCDQMLKDKYKGPALSPKEAEQLEVSARDRLARLNQAIDRLYAAHADPKNVDYATADDVMNTINKLAPELAKDAQALSTVKDDKTRNSLIKAMQELLDATDNISQSIGSDDLQKMQNAANDYSKKVGRLRFILGQADGKSSEADREHERLQFTSTLNETQDRLDQCDKILKNQLNTTPKINMPLWACLGELNAAVASLMAATRDSENPNYLKAEEAMNNIALLMPDVIQDIKYKANGFSPDMRNELMDDTKALINAVRAIGLSSHHGEDTNQAVAEYGRASSKLTYLFDKHAKEKTEHDIIDLAKSTCGKTSELLAHVYGVVDELEDRAAYALDAEGTKVADSAQGLLTSVQITAPTIHKLACKNEVYQSVNDLKSALDSLAYFIELWPPRSQDDKEKIKNLKTEADKELEYLCVAVRMVPEPTVLQDRILPVQPKPIETTSTLKTSISCVSKAVEQAEKDLKKPSSSKPLTPAEAETLKHSLKNKLASLNAAIASLVTTTRDESYVNCDAAASSLATMQRLIPELVTDVQTLSSGKDEKETRALIDELKAMLHATESISAVTLRGDPKELKHAVAQYSKAAGKLSFVCTPSTPLQNHEMHKQLVNNASDLIQRSAKISAAATELATRSSSNNNDIDEKLKRAELAADTLATVVQVTAPTINSSQCRAAIHSTAEELSRAITDLALTACYLDGAGETLESERKEFNNAVQELMETIKKLEDDSLLLNAAAAAAEREKNRLKFVASRSAAQRALENAAQELKKTGKLAPLTPPQATLLQAKLADRLATLNAAIATLLSATRDPENPDYVIAESATATIQELMPDLVKDAKTLPAGKDETARTKLLEHLQELCDATKELTNEKKNLHTAVDKYNNASGKLAYTFNPWANPAKEHQIIDLTKSTCQKTSDLLEKVFELAQGVEGRAGASLDAQGAKVADAAQNLLTTAEITAPSISSPLCQSSLLTSISSLSSSVNQLFSSPVIMLPQYAAKRQQLQQARAKVDQEIERLKAALKDERILDSAAIEKSQKDKLRFIASMASAEVAVQNAEKEITEPYGKPLPASEAAALESSLANRLASLNASINSLVMATNDQNKPDYLAAESASKAIREQIPEIVKDSKSLSSSKDPQARKELLEQVKALCTATLLLGNSAKAEQFSAEELNEAATQYSLASGKLNFVFNPNADQKKTHQILDTCKSTCLKTSAMLQRVHELAKQVEKDGTSSAALDTKGAEVSDAARALLTTAQLTAHSSQSLPCQAALLNASDHLASTAHELQATWVPVVKAPKCKAYGEQLAKDMEAVEMELVTLKRLVTDDGKGVKGKTPPAVPVRTGSIKGARSKGPETRVIKATKEFLDRLRVESSIEKDSLPLKSPTSPSPSRTDEEKRAKLQFTNTVQDARKSICSAEDLLQAAFNSDVKVHASLDNAQIFALNKQMEHKLARANAAAAHLLACRGGDKPDYKLASKCVGAVSDLMPTIARDTITLADLKDPVGRKLFLSDTMGLCSASKSLCETAKNDKKKLKEVALTFGNQSSKLLYALSTDIDPSQEKEVLLRVKAAGDVACRLTEGEIEAPTAGRCAAQATLLMYTAKLVAPSIQDPECQDSLINASKDLSAQLKTIPVTKQPKLAQELQGLEKILETLRTDVASGKLVKRKEEKLEIEDTPLRKLTAQIIEDAKVNAECTTNTAEERRAMADFANKLTDALKTMDVANARCKKAPHDMKKREELEDAVLNLQQLVLQCRPRADADTSQSHIVNLTDYLSDVSTSAEQLSACARAAESGGAARAAAAVAAQCAELRAATAARDHHGAPMIDVDHAAKECVSRVHKINTTIECCPEGSEKTQLQKEARPLNESCKLLQYASQSALAAAQCAAMDEALNDLTDLENRIDKMLQPREGEKYTAQPPSPSAGLARARLATAAAGCAGARDAQQLAPAFTRYVHSMRAHVDVTDHHKRTRLADHLKKLQDRLKLLIMETGRQVVTWRPSNEGEVVAITDDILKELDNADAVIGANTDKATNKIAYEDLKKLLLPVDTYKMEGDKKKLEAKLEPYATKLDSTAETLTLSIGKPGSLARSAHVTAESAVQLTALAKALKSDEDPTKNSRIDETSQELCFVTYNLLKTAESVSEEPNTFESRRRMMDACRSLSDAINKLVRASSSGDKLQRECNELNRSLQMRQSTLQPRPTCALPYAECISSLQAQHDAIKNLKSDEPVSREEFTTSLDFLASAVNNNADYAEHCAYLLSISEQHPELSRDGMFDTTRVQKLVATAQDTCFRVTRPGIVNQAKEESSLLSKQLSDLKQAIQECSTKVKDEGVKKQLLDASTKVDASGMRLQAELNTASVSVEKLTPSAFTTIEELGSLRRVTEHPALAPAAAPSAAAQKRADEVINNSKELLNRASGLMRAIKTSEDQPAMTWVMFNTYTKGVIEVSERVIQCIRENGQQASLIEGALEEDDADMTMKSYAQTQVLIANKWLQKPTYKAQIKIDGEQAARNVIDVGNKMMTHLKDAEREEMRHLVEECQELLTQCSVKYTLETGSTLMDRLKDLAKAIDRSIVTMVVEDLIEDEEPLADLDLLVDAEKDEAKRKFLLERKIADLLAHLGRVTKTARVVADGQGGEGEELRKCSNQAELLAPMLVKAAEKRVIHPTEMAVVEEYQMKLAQYSESLSKVRDLCDRAVDPMQFVQTAEETMQRMKEESNVHQNDLEKCSNTSTAIRKLAHRVINVSMSSQNAQRDPELMRALTAAQHKLREAGPARALRASRLPDWRDSIAEILRATGEVESVLGGEMIFQKQRETDQPIYNAALNLHAAVREWSARDNEIVGVAKRMAVLMAKLSDHMHADKKRDVISTSKAIVAASHEVARLARKLAHECTDMRIRTNLLQVCDQIPTISGQLKMLTTVKGSFLGNQGSDEDIEAMNMLIGNAQNLMTSIQDVVKAAASASVKIRSQRGGPKLRWVRRNYH